MTKSLTGWIIVLVALAELTAAFPSNLPESARLKRQSPAYVPGSCSTCGNLGYGHGLGNYFYGHYGGGYNNNYGGTNIGSINVQNVSG
uniref:Secreted protein n=1 Tax=Ascaris lumbricoides TaxID=6252 RepID=A0A0M3I4M1_ASCLU